MSRFSGLVVLAAWALLGLQSTNQPEITYYRDVAPILDRSCVGCHRVGQIAPFRLDTYEDARSHAKAIAAATRARRMPPWFADPCCGHFANDPSLTNDEIEALSRWAESNAPAGLDDGTQRRTWTNGWSIGEPDAVFAMPVAKRLPALGDIPYQYVIIPTHFKEDRWVRMCEVRPGDRTSVHHAVAYIRAPESHWLRGAPVDRPFSAEDLTDPVQKADAMWTDSDILLVYAPGSSPDSWPEDYAKLLPAGSDIVLQMHYATHGHATEDRTSIGLVFIKRTPAKRVLTLQLTNDSFEIPPGDPDYRVEVQGSIPHDALLLSFFPHMHLRGKTFEYNLVEPHGRVRTLLRIPHYDFLWQLSYRLQSPFELRAGQHLQAIATFDNSSRNPHNPDPTATVRWGDQTWAEMMVGFFDVAVDPAVDKPSYFRRTR
jgi:hypothetical protein